MADILSRIHSAVVLLDADAPDFPEASREVEAFFRKKGISLTVKAVRRRSLYLADSKAELFISLLPPGRNLMLWLNLRRSKALMKAGRSQFKGELFDLVVSSPEGSQFTQADIFRNMIQIMEKIA